MPIGQSSRAGQHSTGTGAPARVRRLDFHQRQLSLPPAVARDNGAGPRAAAFIQAVGDVTHNRAILPAAPEPRYGKRRDLLETDELLLNAAGANPNGVDLAVLTSAS